MECDVDTQRLHRQHLPALQDMLPALPMEDSGPNTVATNIGRHDGQHVVLGMVITVLLGGMADMCVHKALTVPLPQFSVFLLIL